MYNQPTPYQIIIEHFSKSNAIELLPKWFARYQWTNDPIFNPQRGGNSYSFRPSLFDFEEYNDNNNMIKPTSSSHPNEPCKPYRNSLLHQEYVWQPIGMKLDVSHCENYSIYVHLCNRLDQLERIMTRLGDLPMNVIQALKSIQDQYQLLSIHIENQGEYSDNQLYQAGNDHSPLAMFYPRAELSFGLGDLPDLGMQILCCFQMWGEAVDRLFTNPLVELLINSIAKASPAPCKFRSLTTILSEILEEQKKNNTLITQSFNRFIIASLLGIYPHTNIPANFAVRHIIYRYFYLQMGNGEWVEKWISKHKYLIIYVMREYLFYIIEQLPGLYEYFQKNYFWHQIVRNTYYVMDHVRSELNKHVSNYAQFYPVLDDQGDFIGANFEQECGYFQLVNKKMNDNIHWHPSESLFENIEQSLDGFNKTNLSYCYRALSKPFIRLVTHRISALENKNFDLQEYKQQRLTRWNNLNNISTADMIPIAFEKWIEYIVIKCYNLDDPPTYDALSIYFKVTTATVMRLQYAQDLYELETDRSEIDEVLYDIFHENRRDARILQCFFKALEKRMSIIAYPLPENITEKQLQSEINYYGVKDVEYLPIGYGTYPICTNCCEFKFMVYEPQLNTQYVTQDIQYLTFQKPPMELMHTDHTTKISLDLGSGSIFCSRYSFKPDKKNINGGSSSLGNVTNNELIAEFVESMADLDSKRKKKSKNVHKEDHFSKCPCEELSRVNMVGIMLYTDSNGCIMRCINCPTIIKVSRDWSRIGGIGESFACNRCQMIMLKEKSEKERIEKELLEQTTTTTTTTTPSTTTTSTNNEPNNNKKKKVEKFYNRQLPATQPCCLCNKKTRPKRSVKTFLLDDSEETVKEKNVRIRFMAFCKNHEHFHEYVNQRRPNQESLMRLSELRIMYKYEHEAEVKRLQELGQAEGDYQVRRMQKYGPLGSNQKKFKPSKSRRK